MVKVIIPSIKSLEVCVICKDYFEGAEKVRVMKNTVCVVCINKWVENVLQMKTPWDKSEWGNEDE